MICHNDAFPGRYLCLDSKAPSGHYDQAPYLSLLVVSAVTQLPPNLRALFISAPEFALFNYRVIAERLQEAELQLLSRSR